LKKIRLPLKDANREEGAVDALAAGALEVTGRVGRGNVQRLGL
jgi:hypothetical protein